MCPRLSLADDVPQERLQRLHIVMLKGPDISSAKSNAHADRRVVKLVTDNKTTLLNQCGDKCRICRESHGTDKRILHAKELGH